MSSTAFEPYAPLRVPKLLAPELWVVDGPEIRMNFLALRVPFPTRATIVRLPSGELWVHSPVRGSAALFEALEALGAVGHLIAPNSLHHSYIAEWKARFPAARIHAVPGLADKISPPIDSVLGAEPDRAWSGVMDQTLVRGGFLSEAIFFHGPAKTLILTDLIENFEPHRVRRPLLRWALRLAGAADPDGKAPVDLRLSFARHRSAVRAAAEVMLEWEPERIIMAHGRIYDRNGVSELRRAFRWALR
jgi:hypothetical protein